MRKQFIKQLAAFFFLTHIKFEHLFFFVLFTPALLLKFKFELMHFYISIICYREIKIYFLVFRSVCELTTLWPLFTKILTPELTHKLCSPLDDWLDWLIPTPMAETPRHGDIVADTENVLQTVFVYNNENSCYFL